MKNSRARRKTHKKQTKKTSKEVNKQDSDVRLFHFLSYPAHDYLNYHIDSDNCKDEATLSIQNLEQGALLVKTDRKSAFIQLTMFVDDFDLLISV